MSFTQHLGRGLTDQEIDHLNFIASHLLQNDFANQTACALLDIQVEGREPRFVIQELVEADVDQVSNVSLCWPEYVKEYLDSPSGKFTKGQVLLGVDFHQKGAALYELYVSRSETIIIGYPSGGGLVLNRVTDLLVGRSNLANVMEQAVWWLQWNGATSVKIVAVAT